MKRIVLTQICIAALALSASAQKVTTFTTTEKAAWTQGRTALSTKAQGKVVAEVNAQSYGTKFVGFGTTFNELDWDAFNMLTRKEQDKLMYDIFSPEGDLKFTHGRVSMNANDYARAWYSCDEVPGDFALKYFNIEHDKRNIIPLARAAQKYQPQLQLFMSPWSPPTWMKIKHDYPVSPSKYSKTPVVIFRGEDGRYIVTAGNFTDTPSTLSVKVGKKYLNMALAAHSFNTYRVK